MLKSDVKKDDMIRVVSQKKVNTFRVVRNDMGQVYLDSLDYGSPNLKYQFYLTTTSLDGDQLVLKKANKEKEMKKPTNVRGWKTEVLKGVTKIDLIRDGHTIDSVDITKQKPEPKDGKNEKVDFMDEMENNLALIDEQVKQGSGLVLSMSNREELTMCCVSRTNNTIIFELVSETSIDGLEKWDSFVYFVRKDAEGVYYRKSKDMIRTKDDGKSFSLMFKANSGTETKSVWLNGILGITVEDGCGKEQSSDSTPDRQERQLRNDGKKAMDLILNDPTLRKAFYQQPSLWKLFKGELKGKPAEGSGILPTIKLVGRYFDRVFRERMNASFIPHRIVTFRPVEYFTVPYSRNGKKFDYAFNNVDNEGYETVVMDRKLAENWRLKSRDTSQTVRYEVEILNRSEEYQDEFIVNMTIVVKEKTEVRRFTKENVKIDIIRETSQGYLPENGI